MEEHGLYVGTTCRQKEAILQEILKDPLSCLYVILTSTSPPPTRLACVEIVSMPSPWSWWQPEAAGPRPLLRRQRSHLHVCSRFLLLSSHTAMVRRCRWPPNAVLNCNSVYLVNTYKILKSAVENPTLRRFGHPQRKIGGGWRRENVNSQSRTP